MENYEHYDLEPNAWIPVSGQWEFSNKTARYLGPITPEKGSNEAPISFGIALTDIRMRNGRISVEVNLKELPLENEGRVIFGYSAQTREYFTAGIGGHGAAYSISEYEPGAAWWARNMVGSRQNLKANRLYKVDVNISGQKVNLLIDMIKIIDFILPQPPAGDQIGLFAWGPGPVVFDKFKIFKIPRRAFVIMQFGGIFDELYSDVILPVAEEVGYLAYRADDVYKPGIILDDITNSIEESDVIIVDVTPHNPNVYYELGYAHGLKKQKQTVLLVERGEKSILGPKVKTTKRRK